MQNDIPEYVPLEPPAPPKIPEQPRSPKNPASIRQRIGGVLKYVEILGEKDVYHFLGWTHDQIKKSIGLTYDNAKSKIKKSLADKREEKKLECELGRDAKIEKGGQYAKQRALFELLGVRGEGGLIESLFLDEKLKEEGWIAYNIEIKLVKSGRTQEKFDKTKDKPITDAIDKRVEKFTLDTLYTECIELVGDEITPESAKSCVYDYLFAEGNVKPWGYDVQFLQTVKKNTDKYKNECVVLQTELNVKIGNAEQEAKKITDEANKLANDPDDGIIAKANKKAKEITDEAKKLAYDDPDNSIIAKANKKAKEITDKADKLANDPDDGIIAKANKKAKEITDEAESDAKEKAATIIANAEKDAGDIVPNAKKSVKRANRLMVGALITAASVLVLAIPLSLYCVGATAVAKSELAKYKGTFDQRLQTATEIEKTRADEAVKKADAKEADAVALNNSALESHKQANEKQEVADLAYAKAMEEQRIANAAAEQVQKDRIDVERLRNIALEKERIAKEAENQAIALKKEADSIMVESERIRQEGITAKDEARIEILLATQEAERKVAVAETIARKEKERRMGVEAMIEAGAPLRFPLEDNERNDNALQQNDVPNQPVASQAIPLSGYANPASIQKRTTGDILRDLTWRWCLEGELGMVDDSELIGEVTERPRTGYRESEQGSLLSELVYPPPFGAFKRRNLLSPTEMTREIVLNILENEKSDAPWSWEEQILFYAIEKGLWNWERWNWEEWNWEEWRAFRITADKLKEEIGVPHGYTFSLQKDEVLQHKSELDRRYMLAQIPVTQELWESVMGNNPSRFKGAQRPVENVLWEECQEFIAKLNGMKEKLGVPRDYEFTLPWESEWEHACRAGTTTPFHFGLTLDDKQAKFNSDRLFWTDERRNAFGGTSIVGMYPANPWGLHDMHGNVWEWCQDASGYGLLSVERQYSGNSNPIAEGRLPNIIDNFYSKNASVIDGFYRSRRGGSWKTFAENSHSAYRSFGNPTRRNDDVGLRLALAVMR